MANELTPQQQQAVSHRGGKLLVSAAAGSGKTKVLVDRLVGYLTDPIAPANLDEFLIITYTKAAASELRGKIAAKLSERIAQEPENRHLQLQLQRLYLTKISTVHAFCGEILREYAYKLDIAGDFRVADENECRELRTRVLEELLETAYDTACEDPDFRAFADTQGLGRDDRMLGELILSVYDAARCHLLPKAWLQQCLDRMETRTLADAAESEYGRALLQRLQQWLQLQIGAMERCARLAQTQSGFEKPAALLADTVLQLRHLCQSETWDDVVDRKNIDFGTLRFPKDCSDPALADNIRLVRENCKKGLARYLKPFAHASGPVLAELGSTAPAMGGLIGMVRRFEQAYTRAKQSRQVLDFGDLEHKTLDLLLGTARGGPTATANEIGSRFREVMVDEYQDSNAVQDAIYDALTRRKNNLFLVGDVKQSIYQFRLADPEIFLNKYETYAPIGQAEAGQGSKVLLSRNFRSSGGVLAAANAVFRQCMCPQVGGLYYGAEEALYEGVPHIPLDEPEVELLCIDVQSSAYLEEAACTAQRIRQLLDGTHFVREGDALRNIRPEDIAILLRSPGSTGKYFQQALEGCGIRCTTGGGTDLLQAEEIAALRAILQAIHNPMQDIPLLAAMTSPVFGFTSDDLAAMRSRDRGCRIYEVLQQDPSEKSADFLALLLQLRSALRHSSLTGLLEAVLLRTGLEDVYAAMEDGRLRSANIQTFFQLAADFEAGGNRDLGRFLEYLDAMEEKGLICGEESAVAGCVRIMSIHKSKGLEFPVVFLCGLSRAFNMESQRARVLCHKELGLGLSAADTQKRISYPTIAKRAIAARIGADAVSEELRVLYVAMTRARDRLIMTYASKGLEKELHTIVTQLNMGCRQLLIQEADCAGQWVLLTALQRTEAGALFALGGKPEETMPGESAWRIRVMPGVTAEAATAAETVLQPPPANIREILQENLAFRYPHTAATQAPSKQTATQRKGRPKDQEAAENARPDRTPQHRWRKPTFREQTLQGRASGTATHAAMQYIDYAACTDEEAVGRQLQQLVQRHFLTPEQAQMVSCRQIADFFATPLGKKLQSGANVVREFKFSILEDGAAYDPALAGEQVLLQGVVDCALIEEDGITVLDFKTDHVSGDALEAVARRYRPQVQAYAQALQRIYRLPVRQTLLYFFTPGRFVSL